MPRTLRKHILCQTDKTIRQRPRHSEFRTGTRSPMPHSLWQSLFQRSWWRVRPGNSWSTTHFSITPSTPTKVQIRFREITGSVNTFSKPTFLCKLIEISVRLTPCHRLSDIMIKPRRKATSARSRQTFRGSFNQTLSSLTSCSVTSPTTRKSRPLRRMATISRVFTTPSTTLWVDGGT